MSKWLTDEVILELDLRLLEVWGGIPDAKDELTPALLSATLHYAYVTGYLDALTESERGAFLIEHGYAVPQRSATGGAGGPPTDPALKRVPPRGSPSSIDNGRSDR